MYRLFIYCFLVLGLAMPSVAKERPYKPETVRQTPQYLSTNPALVEDTCPGHNIFEPFSCTKQDDPGFTCFDVYRLQGDPIDTERYVLLDQALTTESVSADPRCTFDELTCDNFLKALKYNLDFSFFIDNFPSSSFPECGKTYSCTRISCLLPLSPLQDGTPQSRKLSCVFKKNQLFFLGTNISCRDKNQPSAN